MRAKNGPCQLESNVTGQNFCITAWVCLVVSCVRGLQAQQMPDDFSHSVMPILKTHCVPCHGGREAKGSFSLNTGELLLDSGHVVAGRPEESQLLELVRSQDQKRQMPPDDKPRLTAREIETLTRWIADGAAWEPGFSFAPVAWEPPLRPRMPELPEATNGRTNPIDRILDHAMQQQGTSIPGSIDDATFLRRVSMDLVGLLPSPEKLEQFVNDSSPDKRERVVRELLSDDISYADHWLTFFNDLLRNDYSGTGFITGGRQQISGWLYDALLTNKPFDQFARELIAPPTPASQGYIDGIRWRGEVSAGQTVEIQFAQSVAQSFLGINLKCASCHDSFIDRWKLDESWGLAAVYASAPPEIHRCDKPLGRKAQASWLFPEIGQIDPAAPREERLRQLASLMTHPENGRFSRTIVNRLWYRLMGHGIVHPLDAMQSPPWNADLLDYLASSLVAEHYDLKSILVLIATSEAYQSQTHTRSSDESRPATAFKWNGPVARRMTAEQFIDAVWQLTSAAPTVFDAPVIRTRQSAEKAAMTPLTGKWIWGDSAANGAAPPANESISLRKTFAIETEIASAAVLITCDNGFTLFINGQKAEQGTEWHQPRAISIQHLLKKGENSLLVVATNGGSTPNAAGLFLEARIRMPDGAVRILASDESWQWNPQVPEVRDGRAAVIGGDWLPVTVVPALSVWSEAVNGTGSNLLDQAFNGEIRMVRAGLIKNDFLMRSLGRPHREQIVSMRPEELTTLEAIDLSNGSTLAGFLSHGATTLKAQWQSDRDGLIQHVCRFAWSRSPSTEEAVALQEMLSPDPTVQEIEDLLWAVVMTPEFLLIR